MRERNIEAAFTHYAKSQGCISYKFSSPGRAGVPDRMVATPQGIFFIEFKQKGKRPSVRQEREHLLLRNLGFDVHVCDEVGQAEKILANFLIQDLI